jgi:hypothetical protein
MQLTYEFTGPSFSQYTACRLQTTFCAKGLINRHHISLDMKDCVTLHPVYYICVASAVLHILPYVFELTAVGFAYKLCKLPWVKKLVIHI